MEPVVFLCILTMVERASREEGSCMASFATENRARSYEDTAESMIGSLMRVVQSIVLDGHLCLYIFVLYYGTPGFPE